MIENQWNGIPVDISEFRVFFNTLFGFCKHSNVGIRRCLASPHKKDQKKIIKNFLHGKIKQKTINKRGKRLKNKFCMNLNNL